MVKQIAAAVLGALFLGGCCHGVTLETVDLTKLPPPISLDEQLRRLNERALALPRLILDAKNIGLGSVKLYFTDKQGKVRTEDAEGRIILRQQFAGSGTPADACDIYLRLDKVAQPFFEAGTGQGQWWFIMKGDTKEMYWGQTLAEGVAADSTPQEVFRPDLLIEALAMTPVKIGPWSFIGMRIDDVAGTNDVMLFRQTGSGRGALLRELTINRVTGDVMAVRLCDARGRVAITSQLGDYAEAALADGTRGPRVPHTIIVRYPAQNAAVEIHLSNAAVPPPEKVKEQLFHMPEDLAEQGYKVHRVQ